MHELSLAGGILTLVEDAAKREGFARVSKLHLEMGALSGVELESLRFACEASFAGSVLENAQVQIDTPPADAWCMQCCKSVPIMTRLDDCPDCGGQQLQPTSGTELRVVDLIVHDSR